MLGLRSPDTMLWPVGASIASRGGRHHVATYVDGEKSAVDWKRESSQMSISGLRQRLSASSMWAWIVPESTEALQQVREDR